MKDGGETDIFGRLPTPSRPSSPLPWPKPLRAGRRSGRWGLIQENKVCTFSLQTTHPSKHFCSGSKISVQSFLDTSSVTNYNGRTTTAPGGSYEKTIAPVHFWIIDVRIGWTWLRTGPKGAPHRMRGSDDRQSLPEGKQLMKGAQVWQKAVNDQGGINVGGQRYKVKATFTTTRAMRHRDKTHGEADHRGQSAVSFRTLFQWYHLCHFCHRGEIPDDYDRPSGKCPQHLSTRFQICLLDPAPAPKLAQPIFDLAATLNPKPKTVAIIVANDLFPLSAAEGAKERAEQLGFSVVLFQKYPAETPT